MIRLEHINKIFIRTGAKALDDLSLDIPSGMTVTLIGPSGCGKTTTMRLINALERPSSGMVMVDGRDVATVPPVELRRKIGYVIQQIGLFPHMTIARNVAAVPRLLGWDKARTERRVDELLHLVGLDPAATRTRYPHQLSGGQRQRVGVARALAADPPVMLMDEPFGAIDPINRVRLQDEFKQILRSFGKTVVFVTHDLEEAIKMGDRVAIMRDGQLLQYDTPDRILAAPATEFVEQFIGRDRALKRLNLSQVGDLMKPLDAGHSPAGPAVRAELSLLDALSYLLAHDLRVVDVVNRDGKRIGYLERDRLFSYQSGRLVPEPVND